MTYKHVEQWRSKRFPGISARLRVLSYAQLMRLQEAIEPSVERIEKASAPYIETSRPMTPAERQEYLNTAEIPNDVLRKVAVESSKIDAAYLRAGLVDFSGLNIEDLPEGIKEDSTEALMEYGPPQLAVEIIAEIKRLAGLSEEEQKNSPSPSTSPGGPGPGSAGTAASGSAGDAKPPEITAAGTAANISPSFTGGTIQ